MDPNCSLSLTLDGRSGRTPHPCVSPGPCGWHWKRCTKPTHSTWRSQAAYPARPVRRPAARRRSSWLGRRLASLRLGWPCRAKPWAEAPSEPLPPQATDVDRPGLRSAGTGLALEDLGWSWGRRRKDRAAQPRGVSASALAVCCWCWPPGVCRPLLLRCLGRPPGLWDARLCLCHHAKCLLPGADVLSPGVGIR